MDIAGMMKKAQQLQQKMADMQAELEQLVVEGSSGGGAVTVSLTGKGDMKAVRIDRSLLVPDDVEILEDLIVAAHADARRKAEAEVASRTQALTAGLPIPPGMKLF
jgi:hypothetical protein